MATLTTSKIQYLDPSIVVTHVGATTVFTGTYTTSTNAAVGDTISLDIAGIRLFTAAITVVSATAITIAGTVIPAATYAGQPFDIIKTASTTGSELVLRHSFDDSNKAAQAVVTINGGTNINYDISVKGVIDGIHAPTGSVVTPVEYGTTYLIGTAS